MINATDRRPEMTQTIKVKIEGKKVHLTANCQATAADALDNLEDRIADQLRNDGWVCVADAAMDTEREMIRDWGIDDISIKVVD